MTATTTGPITVQPSHTPNLLSRAVRFNSIFCTTFGVIFLVGAGPIANLLGIHSARVLGGLTGFPFMIALGVILIAYGLGLFALSRQPQIPTWLAVDVIALDVVWVALSAWVIFGNVWPLTLTGAIIVGALADVVLIFAIVQSVGLYRQRRANADEEPT
jgi:hypothetical protein